MSPSHLHVVVSVGQSRNPEKRELEGAIARLAGSLGGVEAISIPHLYDLTAESESMVALRQCDRPIVLLSWLFPRAAHWILDRAGVRGQYGEVLLRSEEEDEDDIDDEENEAEESLPDTVIGSDPRPDRQIYCIDLRAAESVDRFIDEIRRISAIEASPSAAPNSVAAPPIPLATIAGASAESSSLATEPPRVRKIEEHPTRRWYPVIDYSRCTNCMECIDFCLFGVYGVDGAETILVEQPDNCRKGCPACSRVCPANAIIFPQHKTPAIAGAEVDTGGFKIDLSKLFGAPERNEDPAAAAARERDEQLILAGRAAVGDRKGRGEMAESGDLPLPLEGVAASKTKDDFDRLIDQLDQLDL